MSDLHAAVGRVQLRRLEAWTAQRRANAAVLDTAAGAAAPCALAGGEGGQRGKPVSQR